VVLRIACEQNEAAQTLSASAFISRRKQLTYRSNPPLPETQFNLKRKDNPRVIPFRPSKKTTTSSRPSASGKMLTMLFTHDSSSAKGRRRMTYALHSEAKLSTGIPVGATFASSVL
jgi:hypothetical protein